MKKIKIGLFGFGVVGEGIYKVLSQKPDFGAEISKIVIKHPDKKREAPDELFFTDQDEILNDLEIDLVVELINDSEVAYELVSKAMKNGKSVVSANKKMIAERHLDLIALSREYKVSFLYEASVCGSIPIIRNLEEYFDNDLLKSVKGIVNGSTNFILSKMRESNSTYKAALEVAQESGFAERDPSLDVEGIDAAHKLSIIALHAFGRRVGSDKIIRKGITSLTAFDFQYAKEKKWVIKLLARATTNEEGKLNLLSVLPSFVPENGSLGTCNNEFNGVLVGSSLADEQFLGGKGAGRFPTSSAVLSDISAYRYGYKYEYKKGMVETEVVRDGVNKFYISFKKNEAFDSDVFHSIDEQFVGKEVSYIIGDINYQQLVSSGLLNKSNISVISL